MGTIPQGDDVSPMRRPHSLAEHYDQTLHHTRDNCLPEGHPKPQPTAFWPKENITLYERYRDWLLQGGASEGASKIIYLPVAGHVLGLALKPHTELDLEEDFQRAQDYVIAKKSSQDWIKASQNGLNKFRRFLRLERGLGEESKETPFDSARVTKGLPAWLVNELDRYQHRMQRNWRDARMEGNIRRFWSGYLRVWKYFVEQKKVWEFKDLKRQHLLDYVDYCLGKGYAVTGINNDLRNLHTFLVFLQEEGYSVPHSLLKIPSLKQPDPLPRYLTDEQVKKLREEVERKIQDAKLGSHRRLALLTRAAFYLLWQGGMRVSEVEEFAPGRPGFRPKTAFCTEWQGQTGPHCLSHRDHYSCFAGVSGGPGRWEWRSCLPVPQCTFEERSHSQPVEDRRGAGGCEGLSPPIKAHLCNTTSQCGLPGDIHSALSGPQGSRQHDGLCPRA